MNIGIIGLGLIGGSLGLDLRRNSSVNWVFGYDKNESNISRAVELGLIDEGLGLENLCQRSDLIIIAIPVDVASELLPSILDRINNDQIVTDVGSTKSEICKIASSHAMGNRFIGGHPIAGTENSGPEAAIKDLFESKTGILCPVENNDKEVTETIAEMYSELGMKVIKMSPSEHDKHLAYVSHLSHISSFALGLTVLNIEKDEKSIFDLAGSGFESTVRLAKSSADMWNPIFIENADFLLDALSEYIEQLNKFKNGLLDKSSNHLHSLMIEANEVRRVLDGNN
jgi:prephenate dehydrogenase